MLALVVVGLGTAAMANVIVDPFDEFPTQAFPPAPWDAPGHKRSLFLASEPPPSTLILGSSTAMVLPAASWHQATGDTAFNFALPGAAAASSLALYQHAVAEGRTPQHIIVGLDVGRLVTQTPQDDPTRYILSPLHDQPSAWDLAEGARRSLNIGYLQTTIARAWHLAGGAYPAQVAFDSDGTVTYLDLERGADGPPQFDAENPNRLAREDFVAWSGSFDGLHPHQAAAVHALMVAAAANGTNVSLVIMPLHPVRVAELGEPFAAAHEAVVDLARAHCSPAARVFDYMRIDAFGGTAVDFVDTSHMNARNGERLLAALAVGQGDQCAR